VQMSDHVSAATGERAVDKTLSSAGEAGDLSQANTSRWTNVRVHTWLVNGAALVFHAQ
jgi:hypothetical protein